MCGFFFGISDDWHSMLDRVYPNEECIVEDIDDWCVQLRQCTITFDVEENLTIANMSENSAAVGSYVDELD